MFTIERVVMLAYVLAIFTGSYLAVSTLRSLYGEARALEQLATLQADDLDNRKVLVFDDIEPAAGE